MTQSKSTSSSSPRSLSSATAGPKRWSAILLFLASHALVGRTDACSITVTNTYDQALRMVVFNSWDSSCSVSYGSYTIAARSPSNPAGEQSITVDCFGDSGCLIKLGSNPGCFGTVLVDCGGFLNFFQEGNKLNYCDSQHLYCNDLDDKGGSDDRGRMLLLADEEAPEAEDVPGSSSSGGSLRGAKASSGIVPK